MISDVIWFLSQSDYNKLVLFLKMTLFKKEEKEIKQNTSKEETPVDTSHTLEQHFI